MSELDVARALNEKLRARITDMESAFCRLNRQAYDSGVWAGAQRVRERWLLGLLAAIGVGAASVGFYFVVVG